MTTVDTCAHPADGLSTLKSGAIRCTACGANVDPPAPVVQTLVCGSEATELPARRSRRSNS